MIQFRRLTRWLVLSVLLLLASCDQPAPILVYVTPTPVAQIGALYTPTPSAPTEGAAVPSIGALATNTRPPADGDTDRDAARPVTAPAIDPNATIVGPVIGPDYTLPPSSTPEPSATPTRGPSPTPEPQPTDVPPDVPPPTPVPGLNRDQIGIQLDANLDREDWEAIRQRVAQLDVGWVKLQVSWEAMQPNGPDEIGTFFQQTEQFIQQLDLLEDRRFRVLVSVAKAPAWARSVQTEDGPPDDPQLFANFLTLMLNRFGNSIDAVEIWNEPNLQREWQGTLPFSGAGYMQLFAPAYNAVRAYSPSMTIISAGLAPTGDNPGSIDDRTYLQQMYNAGLGNYSDIAIGAHPYSWANPPDVFCCGNDGWDDDPHFFFADTIQEYKNIMNANGHTTQQIWSTEIGWATWDELPGNPPPGSEWMRFTSECEQAHYTLHAMEIAQNDPRLGPMILWNLNFALLPSLVEQGDERVAYSLLLPPPSPERPLYWMLFDALRADIELTDQCVGVGS